MPVQYIHRYPIVRLLIPLIAGIICSNHTYFYIPSFPISCWLWIAVSAFIVMVAAYFLKVFPLRWTYGICSSVFFFLTGAILTNRILNDNAHIYPNHETVYQAYLTGEPEEKNRTILFKARLTGQFDSTSVYAMNQQVLLYFPKDSATLNLSRGTAVWISANIIPPANNGNPDEFDYKRYLHYRGISGIGFIRSGHWKLGNKELPFSLKQKALDVREKVLNLYRESGFSGDDFAVLAALTVGFKDELSDDIRESYSVSGAAHVLALSGLHIGFIYALLFYLLRLIPGKSGISKTVKTLTLLSCLWGFAFITGLSPSVVRAVIMCSLFAISGLRTGRYVSLNAVATAAFLMLIYNPCWLFDVGFQLSFSAVIAIVLFQPRLDRILKTDNRIIRKGWSLISVSLSAQIGTLPLILYYFNRFPTHFLLTNLLVIPLVVIIVYAALCMLITTPIPVINGLIIESVRFLVNLLNNAVRWIEGLPYSSVDQVWLYDWAVPGLYLLIFLTACYIISRKPKLLTASLMVVLVFGIVYTVFRYNDRPENSIVFYNVRYSPVIHCISHNGKSWLVPADTTVNIDQVRRTALGYWMRKGLDNPVKVTSDYRSDFLYYQDGLVVYRGKRVFIINRNDWTKYISEHRLPVDYLYVCNGYKGAIVKLGSIFAYSNIILDGSLPGWKRDKWIEECTRHNLNYISLHNKSFIAYCGNSLTTDKTEKP